MATKKRAKKKIPLPKRSNRTQPNPGNVPKKGETRNPVPKGRQKQRDSKRPNAQGISVEKYTEMAEAFWQIQSVNHVAKTCKVNMATAKKYIEKGDPKRGLTPIRERFKGEVAQKIKEQNRTWAQAMTEWAAIIDTGKKKLKERLEQVAPEDWSADKLIDMLDKLVKDESFVLGGPDSRHEIANDPLERLSFEELTRYLDTGKLPSPDMVGKKGGSFEDE